MSPFWAMNCRLALKRRVTDFAPCTPEAGLRACEPTTLPSAGAVVRNVCQAPAGASKDLIRFGSRSIANSSARAGASGTDRRCSQSRSVVSGRRNASANSRCVRPIRSRNALTREMRRIPESCALVRGAASGSARAALRTSESDIASRRFQSVAPARSPDFAVTRVVAVFFMFRSLAGRNDTAGIFIATGCYNEENTSARHSDDAIALFSIPEAIVSVFDTIGILQGVNCIPKIHAVQLQIEGGLCLVPFVSHKIISTGQFELSLVIHLVTMGLVIGAVAPRLQSGWLVRTLALVTAFSALGEVLYIVLQAARGRASHFNSETPVEIAMYSLMGVGAVLLVVCAFALGLVVAHSPRDGLGQGAKLGVVLGLTVGASLTLVIAGLMSSGVVDGPGHWIGGARSDAQSLPLVGWSTISPCFSTSGTMRGSARTAREVGRQQACERAGTG
jgi:hypothetical protein